MLVLGFNFAGHDASACLLEDGKIIAAITLERLSRIKKDVSFPLLSIDKVLEITNKTLDDVDLVAVAIGTGPKYVKRAYSNYWEDKNILTKVKSFPVFLLKYFLNLALKEDEKRLKNRIYHFKKEFFNKRFVFVDHHLAHAASAYYASGFEECLIVTLDGAGQGDCSTVNIGSRNKIKKIAYTPLFHSIGRLWVYITGILGMTPGRHEGKIVGLAAFKEENPKPVPFDFIKVDGLTFKIPFVKENYGTIDNFNTIYHNYYQRFKDYSPIQIARWVQSSTENAVTKIVENAVQKTGLTKVALAGGVFANVKLNQRILALPNVEEIFIFPAMGDDGLSVGAAYHAWINELKNSGKKIKIPPFNDVYLGPEYTNDEVEATINAFSLKAKYIGDIGSYIAQKLTEKKVIGLFKGRMEFGPRALGNRSILYTPTDVSVNDWLNKRLKRTEFMPFAPSTLVDGASDCYINYPPASLPCKYMTITVDCTETMKETQPAAVHIDGTARPQVVDKQTNEIYYNIIKNFYELTKIPSIINTSFNQHEEPIVCSPVDAILSFKQGSCDILVLNNYVIEYEK